MNKNKEKFLNLVSKEEANIIENSQWRIDNRDWLRVSQKIAFKILDKLSVLKWSQKLLAEKLKVSPQYINKIVKGNENLTLETIVKLERVLGIALLSYSKETKKV